MSKTITELRAKHANEERAFIKACPHLNVCVEDHSFGSRRDITLRCTDCLLNLAGYLIDGEQSYMAYVGDCVKSYPGNIRNTPGSMYYEENADGN
jgi:hypothetical protein